MSSISFSGLSSGLDTSRIIDALVDVARNPLRRLEAKKSYVTAHKDSFSRIRDLLSDLHGSAAGIDTKNEFLAYTASSSNDAVLTAAAGGDAARGNYSVKVDQLARAQKTYSRAFASSTQAGLMTKGTLKIKVGGGDDVSFSIENSTTLEGLAADINASDLEVTAGILYDGSNYRLQVVGNEIGADNAVEFTEKKTNIELHEAANTVQQAQDAQIRVDGFTITRPTNIINDVLAGVTLSLVSSSPDPVAVNILPDSAATSTKVEAFVEAYNAVASEVSAQTRFEGVSDPSKLLGDQTLAGLQRSLGSLVGSQVSGLSGSYTMLAQIGVSLTRDGTLEIDSDKLDDALQDDAVAVAGIFGGDSGAGVVGLAEQLQDLTDEYTDFVDGRLTQRIKGADEQLGLMNDQVDRLQNRISAYEARLSAEYAALEGLMSGLKSQQSYLLRFLSQ